MSLSTTERVETRDLILTPGHQRHASKAHFHVLLVRASALGQLGEGDRRGRAEVEKRGELVLQSHMLKLWPVQAVHGSERSCTERPLLKHRNRRSVPIRHVWLKHGQVCLGRS